MPFPMLLILHAFALTLSISSMDICNCYYLILDALKELLKDITDDISRKCGSHVISRDDIVKSVKQMRPGKNNGFDGLSSDYILDAPMSLF